jgi:hypothetical protein
VNRSGIIAWNNSLYEGKFERIESNRAIGWVRDANNPSRTIFVDLWIDGVKICTAAANEYRGDLALKAKGTGHHGFRIPLMGNLGAASIRITVSDLDLEIGCKSAEFIIGELQDKAREETISIQNLNVFFHLGKDDFVKSAAGLLGKDMWLFLAMDSNAVLNQIRSRSPIRQDDLSKYQTIMMERMARFSDLNIPYIFCIAPTKEIIYDDYLPDDFDIDLSLYPMNQITSCLDAVGFKTYPLHDSVKRARLIYESVFYRTDTHWNIFGAFAAYQQIFNLLSQHVHIGFMASLDDFSIKKQDGYRGDLADKPHLVFMPNYVNEFIKIRPGELPFSAFSESVSVIVSDGRFKSANVPDYLKVSKTRDTVIHETGDSSKPTILIFHDSFMINLRQFISPHFFRAIYIWKADVDFGIVERVRPDIVLHVMLDRFMRLVPNY